MRISDWSSDVCSSDLDGLLVQRLRAAAIGERQEITVVVSNVGTEVITVRPGDMIAQLTFTPIIRATLQFAPHENAALPATAAQSQKRTEERRVGQECVSTCRSRW